MIQQRNIAVCIILSIITCGIYGLYWFVCITNDTNTAANTEGTSGGVALILSIITCNIYGLYWAYKQEEKIDMARQNHGMPSNNSNILYLLLCLFVPVVAWALMQNELNSFADSNN
ncbi:MAG TPA: hypothetical protein DCZ40_02335 [Lachnospiraceae bacterium]|nr:hypothetical protein [Lachnospiraceae bacterium]